MIRSEIGVIVGRFQVHELHPGHCALINQVLENHKKVIIFLGCSPLLTTKNNPLDFASRQKMLSKAIATDTIILPILDTPDDVEWSNNLDIKIREVFPIGAVTLYGGRDSFINFYRGKFPTEEIGKEIYISGTEIRNQIKKSVGATEEFRAGVIYGAYNQYPKVFPTVDIAIIRNDEFLLGRKSNQSKFRFIGGFVDPTDNSFDFAAKREVFEETGLEIGDLKYIGNYKIDDWRYRNEEDKIITSFFLGTYIFGKPQPNDDIVELRWWKYFDFDLNNMVLEHHCLYKGFFNKINGG